MYHNGTLTSRKHPLVQSFRRAARGDDRLALLDGWHLLRDAVDAGLIIETVAVAGDIKDLDARQLVSRLGDQSETRVVTVSSAVMNAMSPVKTPSGVVALAHRPDMELPRLLQPAPPLILVAVDMQDPGNVGSLIRSAEAGGATGVVLTGDSADPWGWKALRAAMGSTFRLPVLLARDASHVCEQLRSHHVQLIATLPRGATPMHDVDLRDATGILLGGEGSGLSADAVSTTDLTVSIPMRPGVESLNVAVSAALLVYEAFRQRSATTGTENG